MKARKWIFRVRLRHLPSNLDEDDMRCLLNEQRIATRQISLDSLMTLQCVLPNATPRRSRETSFSIVVEQIEIFCFGLVDTLTRR
jgi:hypothetical protein